jgi:hypothetical protein
MNQEFKNSYSSQTVKNVALLFLWIAIPLMVFIFLLSLIALISGQAKYPNVVIALIVSTFGIYSAIAIPFQIINEYNKVRVTEEGLYIQVYLFRYRWKLVKWEDIFDVKLISSPDRWRNPQWIIRVRQLTYWHKLISQRYRCGSGPGIVINSDIKDREKLLDLIQSKLEKN